MPSKVGYLRYAESFATLSESVARMNAETASRDQKLAILEEKAKTTIMNKKYRAYHAIVGNPPTKTFTWERLWGWIVDADPTKNKQYLQWIITKAITNNSGWYGRMFRIWEEDLISLRSFLEDYHELKLKNKVPVEFKDIQKFKDDVALTKYVNELKKELANLSEKEVEDTETRLFSNKEAKVEYESSTLRIISLKTHEASCFFGRGTKWCTTIPKRNEIFEDYAAEGPLFIVEDKTTKEKYQFHFESDQFMDADDKPINFGKLHKTQAVFMKELVNKFDRLATKHSHPGLMKRPTAEIYFKNVTMPRLAMMEIATLMNEHVAYNLTEKEKLEYLTYYLKYMFKGRSDLPWFKSGAAESAMGYMFYMYPEPYQERFPYILMKTKLDADIVRRVILTVIDTTARYTTAIVETFEKQYKEPLFNKFPRPAVRDVAMVDRSGWKGTYGSVHITKASQRKLHEYFKGVIPNLQEASKFHVTTIYTKKIIDIESSIAAVTLSSKDFKYEKFGENVLVLRVKNEVLNRLHKEAKSKGATWDFPSYKPHITLSTTFPTDLANLPPLPDFNLYTTRHIVEELEDK